MKKLAIFITAFLPFISAAQFAVKGGVNFANVSGSSSFNSSSRSGFHFGIALAPATKKIISNRTELIFSRQGYDYKSASNTGEVNLDYIQFGQMMSINITKYFSVLAGAQTAYLINAKVDSAANGGTGNGMADGIMSLYNRFDYGFALGAEVHPFKGMLLGMRYNISLNKLYESATTGQMPSFSSEDAKNNVVQVYVGWRLGK